MKEEIVKNLRTIVFILSACLMMVYSLSCAHVSVGQSAGLGLGYEQGSEPAVPDDTLEPITANSKSNEIKLTVNKIIVHPVVRKISSVE